jgi:hypothetical protein
VKTSDPAIPFAAERLGRSIFSGLVVGASTLGGSVTFAHDRSLGWGLFGVAAIAFLAHVVGELRRRSPSAG